MHLQGLIVTLLVAGCALHATWRLMPAALRRMLSTKLLHREPPAASGCSSGCDGCGSTAKVAAAKGAAQPIAFHPHRPR